MLQTALSFLENHKEITLATCEGNLPKLRIFQIMRLLKYVFIKFYKIS